MRLLVTSAAGFNGNGFGALLRFDLDGNPLGVFSDDGRIADPRGLCVDRAKGLLYLNSGADRKACSISTAAPTEYSLSDRMAGSCETQARSKGLTPVGGI
ncbi:hypothetical protein [Paenibacillus sp. yr247]|uniref:hypothetical protein n=1 Tax=Paenibacillus sp. yr247 TaxID=1761880 RepID=UPI001C315809|nr:hypothetical protein [Paenibacillus sp. yr247]